MDRHLSPCVKLASADRWSSIRLGATRHVHCTEWELTTGLRQASAHISLSSVIGKSRIRFPVALKAALAMAAAAPVMPISPTPRAPSGACSSGISV
jgi:hypothetical protein